MNFVEPAFPVFFGVVYLLYRLLRTRRRQNLLLLVASAVFYGWVHPWFLLLILGSGTLDFLAARGMTRRPHRRRAWMAASLAGNLGALGFFKYFDWFLENTARLLGWMGLDPGPGALGIFLPVAISFYTLQTLGYTLDVYRGRTEARTRYLDYLVYVAFFPQLVAGPVERAEHLLPQVERERRITWAATRSGLVLALWGAFQKVAIADTLAPRVDAVFAMEAPSAVLLGAAAVAFGVQILADFSGYTDIARGTAGMLGFELVPNFRHPYLAAHPSAFWRRWHISLSTWIRDYVYIPLGGSRRGRLRTGVNTWIAMLVAGLWHGAAWNFLAWGVWHAGALSLSRGIRPRIPRGLRRRLPVRIPAVVGMYGVTTAGWLLFRDRDLAALGRVLQSDSPWGGADHAVLAVALLVLTLLCAVPFWLAWFWERWLAPRLASSPWRLPLQGLAVGLLLVFVLTLARSGARDFIYFRF